MKKITIFIALTMIATLASVSSCKNNKSYNRNESADPTQEDILQQKEDLSDTLLSLVDKFAEQFLEAETKSFHITELVLTEDEKLVKPDYLLDPSLAGSFVLNSQKKSALAMYILEYYVRELYDMPLDEAKAAISKLIAETNGSGEKVLLNDDISYSERIKMEYENSKKQGTLADFWRFQCVLTLHTDYIIANNPDLFISKFTEEGLQAFNHKIEYVKDIVKTLAAYDPQMKALLKEITTWDLLETGDEGYETFDTESSTAQFYRKYKKAIINRRNAMLQ